MAQARDKFWMFGVKAHQDDPWLGRGHDNRNYTQSRITPAEGAFMLDIPNMLMVNCDGIPVPFSHDAYGYAESFCRMDKVLWSVMGSHGFRAGNEEAFVCDLAEKFPNIKGAFMDDFLLKFRGLPDATERAVALLKEVRTGLDKACRPMELYVVWYTLELGMTDPQIMKYIDGLTLWTWNSKELPELPARFEKIEKSFPDKKKLLGIYMYDFEAGEPLSDVLMEFQCEYGLKLMKEGRLDGMIFECNAEMGVGLSSEYWLRKWIERVKYTEIPD